MHTYSERKFAMGLNTTCKVLFNTETPRDMEIQIVGHEFGINSIGFVVPDLFFSHSMSFPQFSFLAASFIALFHHQSDKHHKEES